MTNGSADITQNYTTRCEVCDGKVSHANALLQRNQQYLVCHSADCRSIVSRKALMSPSNFKPFLEFNQKIIRERRVLDAKSFQFTKDILQKEKNENSEFLKIYLKENSNFNDEVELVSLPSGFLEEGLLNKNKTDKYVQHLEQIVTEASQYDDVSEVIYDVHYHAQKNYRNLSNVFLRSLNQE